MDRFEAEEKYGHYRFDDHSRAAHRRRGRPPTPKGWGWRKHAAARDALADESDTVDDWVPTAVAGIDPKHHERRFVIDGVAPFYRNQQVTDVLRLVKGGKEANVYCCAATPATGHTLLAAKLYRPRPLRHLKNDAIYKAGRALRGPDGKLLRNERRVQLALAKKTRFGKQVDISWWIGNEFLTQKMLFEAGADVPEPIGRIGNAILMAFIGDESQTAPTLSEVRLAPEEAPALFERIMANVRLMLRHDQVHGDLSAYNILYWQGNVTIIDFPQMVDARNNPYAEKLLRRDIKRVAQYFARHGVASDPAALAAELWQCHRDNAW